MLDLIAMLLAVGIAFNIGISNAGVPLSTAYGSGAISKAKALILTAIFVFLGAIVLGNKIINTLSIEIFTRTPDENFALVIVAPIISLIMLIIANVVKIPISPAHIITSTLLGIGFFYDMLNVSKTITIFVWWIATPIVSVLLGYFVSKLLFKYVKMRVNTFRPSVRKKTSAILILAGCYSAFVLGANMVAKGASFLAASQIFSVNYAKFFTAVFLVLGIIFFGSRMIETVGTKIALFCQVRAIFIISVSATIGLIAALYGIPISQNQVLTAAVIGVSSATDPSCHIFENRIVRKTAITWAVSPFLAAGLTYSIVKFIL